MVAILGQILGVQHCPEAVPSYICKRQFLFKSTSRTELSAWNLLLLGDLNKPRLFRVDELDNLSEITDLSMLCKQTWNSDYNWFHSYFSADEKYLIVLESMGISSDLMFAFATPCIIHIYENLHGSMRHVPSFKLMTSVGVHLRGSLRQNVCVHPTQPLLVLNRFDKPVLWKWDEKGNLIA